MTIYREIHNHVTFYLAAPIIGFLRLEMDTFVRKLDTVRRYLIHHSNTPLLLQANFKIPFEGDSKLDPLTCSLFT